MDNTATRTTVEQLMQAIRTGDAKGASALISPEWLDGGSRPGQPAAPDVWRGLLTDVFGAFGSLEVSTTGERVEGEVFSCRLTVAGTHTGNLWGLPGTGRRTSTSATLKARLVGGRLAVAFEDANLIGALREIGVAPKPEVAHIPPVHPVSLPEMIMKMAFNGGALEKPCSHLDQIRVHEPQTQVCEKCAATSTPWVALRMCVTCGNVACCDVAVGKHAIAHHKEGGHPLVRSINRSESWLWCYVDKTILSARW